MVVNKSLSSITLKNDERITTFGRMLRRTKLDELPQVLNVIKGEMSLVGPRPDVPGFSDKLEGNDQLIWNLKPGLTGIDSISYPFEDDLLANKDDPETYYNKVLWPTKVKLNVWYACNRNCWLDFRILINTISLLVFRKQWFIILVNSNKP